MIPPDEIAPGHNELHTRPAMGMHWHRLSRPDPSTQYSDLFVLQHNGVMVRCGHHRIQRIRPGPCALFGVWSCGTHRQPPVPHFTSVTETWFLKALLRD